MTLRQQKFTSPGTWTWPGNVSRVEVILVGGGGGGADVAIVGGTNPRSGGGGGFRQTFVPVSGPVSVTVGSGGVTGPYPGTATIGGTSSFGPVSVDGGGHGGVAAPDNGGGGGANIAGGSGRYGTPGIQSNNGAGGAGITALLQPNKTTSVNGVWDHYGAGGYVSVNGDGRFWGQPIGPTTVVAGSGAGGCTGFTPSVNGTGGSVIVKWFE